MSSDVSNTFFMAMIPYLQLVHHFVKEFSGLGAVGVFKVIFYTDLDYNRFQVTTHTCEEGEAGSE